MTGALLDLSRGAGPDDEILSAVLLARRINRILGGAFISPWEIGDLPEDAIESILSIEQVPAFQSGRAKVEKSMRDWRESHPAYRKVQ